VVAGIVKQYMLLPYAKCQTVLEAMVPFSISGTDWTGAE
jgi:hypothetical protein